MTYSARENETAQAVLEYARHLAQHAEREYQRRLDGQLLDDALMDAGMFRRKGSQGESDPLALLEGRLKGDALALLGHPFHALSRRRYNDEGYRFLLSFIEEGGKVR